MKELICPYCKKPIHSICKKFGEAAHMRGCYKKIFGNKSDGEKITLDYYQYNFSNCNKSFFEEKIREGYSVFELDNEFFDGLNITRKCCNILGIKLPSLKEALQLTRQKEKREKTNIERYGFKNVLCEGSKKREKRNKTMIKKYGVENYFSIENFQTILKEKMGTEEYHKRKSERSKQVWALKTTKEKEKWLEDSIHCHIKDDNGLWASKQELLLREKISQLGLKIKPQEKIGDFYFDILLIGTKILIEYNGDYWHANPSFYKEDDLLYNNLTAKDIWNRDCLKKQTAEKMGYKVITIWEHDFLNKELEEILEEKLYGNSKD